MIQTKDLFSGGKSLDEKSLEMLAKVIEQNNLPGFDYYEFKRSVTMLQEMKLDEVTAYKSAFQTASTVGVTKEKLLETAQYYRNLMEKEQNSFTAALEKQNQKRITDRQTEIARLKDQIARHEEQLARLQEEIAAYKNEAAQAEQQITTDTEKLAATQNAFGTTFQAVLFTIDSDLEKIHQYLA
jgi:septal ring factor EnvC (AmiA/AmiB activator)